MTRHGAPWIGVPRGHWDQGVCCSCDEIFPLVSLSDCDFCEHDACDDHIMASVVIFDGNSFDLWLCVHCDWLQASSGSHQCLPCGVTLPRKVRVSSHPRNGELTLLARFEGFVSSTLHSFLGCSLTSTVASYAARPCRFLRWLYDAGFEPLVGSSEYPGASDTMY